ncbi:MAG TPA: MEDS domain-containing protein [Vitreimonas sp.]|nr:MEDS domain-containing protein [Vitreimonas sp.]
MTDAHLRERLDGHDCPHLAALLQSRDDLPRVLCSFFALGAARNGWLVQGTLPGEAEGDRRRLAEAGLDVDRLERTAQLSIVELDLTLDPEAWVDEWSVTLDARLDAGFAAVWFARFPVGAKESEVQAVLPFEEAWMERFRDRPMVTLCPYIVPALKQRQNPAQAYSFAAVHDDVLDLRTA